MRPACVVSALSVFAMVVLTACQPIQPLPQEADASQGTSQPDDSILIEVDDTSISGPQALPAGLTPITIHNSGTDGHSAILRRLNDDVPFEEWQKVIAEDPIASFPLTFLHGGPDLKPGESIDALYLLEPGLYIVVDNWVDPHRYFTFDVLASDSAPVETPAADVSVRMSEYSFDAPDVIPSGTHLWQLENTGAAPHHMGVIQLEEGATVEDIQTWWDTEEGPPPFADVAWWNTMSPGARAWASLSLEPGAYLLFDFLPDAAHDGAPNFRQGMVKALTVE